MDDQTCDPQPSRTPQASTALLQTGATSIATCSRPAPLALQPLHQTPLLSTWMPLRPRTSGTGDWFSPPPRAPPPRRPERLWTTVTPPKPTVIYPSLFRSRNCSTRTRITARSQEALTLLLIMMIWQTVIKTAAAVHRAGRSDNGFT